MTRQELKVMKRSGKERRVFEELHQRGAEKFGYNWIKVNQWVIDVANEFGLRPTEHRLMLSTMAWKMLVNMG
jgi:hypothetical protein